MNLIISPSLTGRERCHEVTESVGLEGAGGHGVRKVKNNNKDIPPAPQRGAGYVARGKPERRNPG